MGQSLAIDQITVAEAISRFVMQVDDLPPILVDVGYPTGALDDAKPLGGTIALGVDDLAFGIMPQLHAF